MSTSPPVPALAQLPEPVRARVVALAADVLPALGQLPPALRRVATFAPARRAKLGATAIATALREEDLRARVASHLAVQPPATSTPVDRAAVAWLVRAGAWEAELAAALDEVAPAGPTREESEVARLRDRLDAAERAAREQRAMHRAQVDEVKAENTTLRRRLGEARAAEKAARAAAEQAAAQVDGLRREVEALASAQEREVRRLRARVAELEADAASGRRAVRAERDEATVRARVLLETVVEAAAGLRRELGLPSVTGAPADRVEAGLSAGVAEGARVLTGASAGLLEQYLAMPRARLVVDGYNVSKSIWPTSPLEAQRIRLVNALAPLVARTGADTTVVFDAGQVGQGARPVVAAPRGVRVYFSPEGTIADDVIRDLVAAEPPGRVVVVVTGDQAVLADVTRAGARGASVDALASLIS
ncbi:NYN domain-containing protein [Nocardioides marmotae]|uniref:NYN domain-containing protein n=1 Tax=Nocardioides marmotae TaxID=2663857 RepID=UPI0012B63F10|nr:NYN domain-containing protein [Nocardioides marmotae]MBC9732162.1 NYN domain-containing protein [Nocardioides marmotae]MTB83283.1 RNA-binding protein [Nocardioides marmotae]